MKTNIRTFAWGLAVLGCSMIVLQGVSVGAAAKTAGEKVLFEDRFDGKLADGWTWLRQNPDAWRFRDGALEIRIEPGVAHNVITVGSAVPDGAGAEVSAECAEELAVVSAASSPPQAVSSAPDSSRTAAQAGRIRIVMGRSSLLLGHPSGENHRKRRRGTRPLTFTRCQGLS